MCDRITSGSGRRYFLCCTCGVCLFARPKPLIPAGRATVGTYQPLQTLPPPQFPLPPLCDSGATKDRLHHVARARLRLSPTAIPKGHCHHCSGVHLLTAVFTVLRFLAHFGWWHCRGSEVTLFRVARAGVSIFPTAVLDREPSRTLGVHAYVG